MNSAFTKLTAVTNPGPWTDQKFAVMAEPKNFVDYVSIFEGDKNIWAAWCSYLERHKLNEDYTLKQPPWLTWLYGYEKHYSLEKVLLSPAVQAHYEKFRAFYKARCEEEEKQRKAAELAQREARRLEVKPAAYHVFGSQSESSHCRPASIQQP
jgi:hypothetical protein